VRDFAFASSRKFMWDAQVVKQETKNVVDARATPQSILPPALQHSVT
jgi:hypothetical protein